MRALFVAAIMAGIAAAEPGDGGPPAPPPPQPCVTSWPESRYGAIGYNHTVHLRNDCTRPSNCVVSTDVNPEPVAVEVPPQAELAVTTFLGSPSYVFRAHVACTP